MSSNKKSFIYYSRVSVKEGLNIESNTSELMLDKYNKEVYRRCRYCCCVIETKKGFKEDSSVRNMCFKLIQNQDKINPQIHIIWTENQKYMFRMENIKYKCGEILLETIEIYLNS